MTLLDIIKDALQDIGVLAAGESPEPEDEQLALRTVNRILDSWNFQTRAIFNVNFTEFSWTANQTSRTIGPTGNFVVNQRPDEILSARWKWTSSTPNIYYRIAIRDQQWWGTRTIRNYGTTIPTNLYYSPDYSIATDQAGNANGTIYLLPFPTVTYPIELELKNTFSRFTAITDTFNFPQGYEEAVEKTLAEKLCLPFGKSASGDLLREARNARAVIKGSNVPPRIKTNELDGAGTGFDYRTRDIL
jgi:hypothetical protein